MIELAQTWDGPFKQSVRKLLFNEPKGFINAAWLTGYQLLDVDLASKSGFIAPHASITVVERNAVNYKAILGEASKKYPSSKLVFGEIENQNFHELDFLNLDLCGMLSKKICGWLRSLLISKGGSIYVNLCYAKRMSYFMHDANDLIKGKHRTLLTDVFDKYKIRDTNIGVQMVLLLSALRNYRFNLLKPIHYPGNHRVISMTTFRVVDMCPCDPVFPDLLTELGVNVMAKKKSPAELSEIANRAVATRRENELAKKRHEAAKKAWDTRRSQTLQESATSASTIDKWFKQVETGKLSMDELRKRVKELAV